MEQALARTDHYFEGFVPAGNLPELIAREDAGAVWERVFELISNMVPGNQDRIEVLTQEVFLWLMTTRAFEKFMVEGISDEEMVLRLLSITIDMTVVQSCRAYARSLVVS